MDGDNGVTDGQSDERTADISRVVVPDVPCDIPVGVSAPARDRPAEIVGVPFLHVEAEFHWYEKIRILGWQVSSAAQIVRVLALLNTLFSQIANHMNTNALVSTVTTILTVVLTLLATWHILPGVTTDNAASIAGTIATSGFGLVGVLLSIFHAQNAAAASAAAKTVSGLPASLDKSAQ